MSESVIADFVGRFVRESSGSPKRGRILLGKQRLVVTDGDEKTTIALKSVFDVTLGLMTPDVAQHFDNGVTVKYAADGDKRSVVIESDRDTLRQFTKVLFRVILNGTKVLVRHPAGERGLVTNASLEKGILYARSDSLEFGKIGDPFAIDHADVVDFEKELRSPDADRQKGVSIEWYRDEQMVRTEVFFASERRAHLLSQLVHLCSEDFEEQVRKTRIRDSEIRILVALYSTGSMHDISELVDIQGKRMDARMSSLQGKGLVKEEGGQYQLTKRGLSAIYSRVESDF